MIAMVVVMAAMAAKAGMDAKKNASVQRKNAIAQQKIEQEALLQRKAEQGDAKAMEAFEKARANRVDAARVMASAGEQGATTGNFQMDTMLQGLGFGTGLQNTADQRSDEAQKANMDLQLRGSGISFTNKMRTINASDPSGVSIAINTIGAGASAYAGAPGALTLPTKPTNTGGSRGIDVLGHT